MGCGGALQEGPAFWLLVGVGSHWRWSSRSKPASVIPWLVVSSLQGSSQEESLSFPGQVFAHLGSVVVAGASREGSSFLLADLSVSVTRSRLGWDPPEPWGAWAGSLPIISQF